MVTFCRRHPKKPCHRRQGGLWDRAIGAVSLPRNPELDTAKHVCSVSPAGAVRQPRCGKRHKNVCSAALLFRGSQSLFRCPHLIFGLLDGLGLEAVVQCRGCLKRFFQPTQGELEAFLGIFDGLCGLGRAADGLCKAFKVFEDSRAPEGFAQPACACEIAYNGISLAARARPSFERQGTSAFRARAG